MKKVFAECSEYGHKSGTVYCYRAEHLNKQHEELVLSREHKHLGYNQPVTDSLKLVVNFKYIRVW